jgi:predicted transcriptional regulator of viral defense system
LVEALSLGPTIKPARLRSLASDLKLNRGLRRLGSLLDHLGHSELAHSLYRPGFRHPIELEPNTGSEVQFVDEKWRVLWNVDAGSVLGTASQ